MDQTRQSLGESIAHNIPPPLNSIGNTHFVDFSFPFQSVGNGVEGIDESTIEHQSPINIARTGSVSDRRESFAGRTSFSSGGPLAYGHDGSEGSDEASPQSARPRENSFTNGYVDEFGVNHGAAQDGNDLGSKSRTGNDGKTAAWSELKTKAGKERKRLPLACIACRRKKIRCSGEKPACKHCLKSRIPCVYRITTRKAAPRTDYMAMLDKRLKRMEERIIKILPKEEYDPTAVTRAQVKPVIPGATGARSDMPKKRAAEEAFGPELDTWANPTSSGNSDGGVTSSLLTQEAEEGKLLTEGMDTLPSQEIQEHLAEVYFENLHGQAYHLLHKPSFMRKLKAGTVPPVLILAVCAVSARFSSHPKLRTDPAFLRGESWSSVARDIVMKRYDWPNITILTCLLLLGLHEFGTCFGGRSWALGGMAIRMAYALQLHKDLEFDPLKRNSKNQLSFIDREIRRRTMWACFLMDRFNSSGTDRPMFVKEESIKVQLPIKEKFFQLDIAGPTEDLQGNIPYPVSPDDGQLSNPKDNMGVAAYMIRAIALWGRIIIYLFQGGRELDGRQAWDPKSKYADLARQTDGFATQLPDFLKFSQENLSTHETEGLSNQFLFLHIASQQSKLFLNHIAVHGHPGGRPPKDTPRDFVAKTTANSFEAATLISELLREAETHFVTAPFAGYCAFMSSVVQMTAVFSKNPKIESVAKKNLATNVRYLAKMKRFWGAFHWTSEHLKEQFRTCADAARKGPGANIDDAQASIYQYGDWFDRYPHGVSQTDFEDPAANVKKEKGDDAVLGEKSDYHTVEEFFNTLLPFSSHEHEKPKRKSRKSFSGGSQQQSDASRLSSSSGIILPNQTMQITNTQQMAYPSMSPTDANMFSQPAFYGHDLLFPPHPQGMLPQLDRQLVFGAYAGMDPTAGMLESNWDMGANSLGGYAEPTSAWFMPFNMEPPEIGQDGTFGSFGGYRPGGLPLSDQGTVNENRMDMGGLPMNNQGIGNENIIDMNMDIGGAGNGS